MTARFKDRLGSGLIEVLDRISRPGRRNSGNSRKQRLNALEFVANEASSALLAVTVGGLVLVLALVLVPPPFWSKLDKVFRVAYWGLFTAQVYKFERALQEKDEIRIQERSRPFFDLADDLRLRDHGEARYVRALESALSSATPAVRLGAAETGVALRPNDSLFWYHLGIERLRAGQGGPGIEALQKSFRFRPYSRQAASALIRAFEQTGNKDAILRVRAEYASGVLMVAGKRVALHVMYARPDGGIEGKLLRFDACSPIRLALRDGSDLQLKAVYFPPIDGLRASVDALAVQAIERLQHFRAVPEGGFVSEITPGDAFMAAPGIFFKGSPPESSVQMEFCMAGGGAL